MSEPNTLKRAVNAPAVKQEGWWETVKVIAQALIIALVVRALLFQPFNIPSGSLVPSLLIGDYLFVSKYSYGYSHYSLPGFLDLAPSAMPGRIWFSPPKRGDIIVFRPPGKPDQDYIKRLIGLPGDVIQMKENRLYINDRIVPREPAEPYAYRDRDDETRDVAHYYETLPDNDMRPAGVRHEIIEIVGDANPWRYTANTEPYKVPPGNYFFMGDNRDNSSDSRVPPDKDGVGFVPAENLIGRAEVIFFSVEGAPAWEFWRWPWTVRWNRMFHVVR
jgi:signal peptidase I